jgi:spermidine synthase
LRRSGPLLLVYTLTLFLSALLLFLVQPLIGKLIVPLLGGFPSVWNTCMVFFQAMLLAGYAYAHYSTAWLGARRQAALHLGVLLLPAVVLPLGVSKALVPAGEDNPVPGLLLLLLVSAGLPFFAIATTAPLVQRWFANTDHPAARDPYFLYAASNVGSMLALIGYPLLVEPYLTLTQQRLAWSLAYGLLVLLLAVCAVLLWKSPEPALKVPASPKKKAPAIALQTPPEAITTAAALRRFAGDFAGPSLMAKPALKADEEVTLGRALRWVALAAVPSSLMLGVTTYITTDIAAIPLLWVLPLALYLLSFILVFSNLPAWFHKFVVLALPVLLLLLVFLIVSGSKMRAQMWAVILLHVTVLFGVALVCHGELARDRPPPRQLTRFYLLMSLGGVLGGLFNALVAPLLFTSLAEYPLALVAAALLVPRLDDAEGAPSPRTRRLDLLLPAALAVLCLEFFGVRAAEPFPATHLMLGKDAADKIAEGVGGLAESLHISAGHLKAILCYGPLVVLAYLFVERPLRFGLGVAAILFASAVPAVFNTDHETLYRDRSFFGILNVKGDDNEPDVKLVTHRLMHGRILHGTQYQGDARREPLTYYHRTGPIGQLLEAFTGDAAKKDVAVIGLGTGTMAAYAEPGQHYTFYEIDRAVKAISFDQKQYFSYVQDAQERGAQVDVVLGDARLSLERECQTRPERKYDVIVVDAFSSDAIPVHLLTREALQIYRAKLKDDGIIAFHTSNRYLRLEPVLANLAAAEDMAALAQHDYDETPRGKSTSSWVMLANKGSAFGKLLDDVHEKENDGKRWERMKEVPRVGLWTDDYSNLLRVFDWEGKN